MRKPIYSLDDVVYMRYLKNWGVLRVARFDSFKEMVLVLYPTDDPSTFSAEAFHKIDDNSPRRLIKKDSLKDKVWVRLLGGEPIEGILADYQAEYLGAGTGDSYHYCKRGSSYEECRKHRTFHIVPDKDEEEILKRLNRSKAAA